MFGSSARPSAYQTSERVGMNIISGLWCFFVAIMCYSSGHSFTSSANEMSAFIVSENRTKLLQLLAWLASILVVALKWYFVSVLRQCLINQTWQIQLSSFVSTCTDEAERKICSKSKFRFYMLVSHNRDCLTYATLYIVYMYTHLLSISCCEQAGTSCIENVDAWKHIFVRIKANLIYEIQIKTFNLTVWVFKASELKNEYDAT